MKYRLYHGHDCNSATGFNNGSYLRDEYASEQEARDAAEAHLAPLKGEWLGTDPDIYEIVTGYYDEQGNEISEDEFDTDLGHSYAYQFIAVEEVREQGKSIWD